MTRHALLALLCSILCACLEAPPPPPATDAGLDAGAPALAVSSLAVTDLEGRAWPTDAIPRSPRIGIDMTGALLSPDDPEDHPIRLLRLGADGDLEALIEDAERAPLRAAHRDLEIALRRLGGGARWTVEPTERLERGERLTLLVAGWAESATGQELGTPWVETLRVSTAPGAGTEALASWPADGTGAVSTSLREIALSFDGPVRDAGAAALLGPDGARVPVAARRADCDPLAFEAHTCLVLELAEPLSPSRTYTIAVGEEARDPTGASIGPWAASFGTGDGPDLVAPGLLPPTCALDELALPEGCLLADDATVTLRILADEPVRATLALAGLEARVLAPRGEATLGLGGLPAGVELDGLLRLVDLAGNEEARALTLSTLASLDRLAITEVRADPQGPEPEQEYVEVLNYGDVPLDLASIALSDRPDRLGDVVERPLTLAPGQRALLVADRFDPEEPSDDPVPPGIPLVRVGASLASGGLTNAGEPLFLRDGAGRRLSAAPSVDVPAGRCLQRRDGASMRDGSASAFQVAPCTPGLP